MFYVDSSELRVACPQQRFARDECSQFMKVLIVPRVTGDHKIQPLKSLGRPKLQRKMLSVSPGCVTAV